MAESEIAKNSFLKLKENAEHILAQLKEEARKQEETSSTASHHPLYAQVTKRKTKQAELDKRRVSVHCTPPGQVSEEMRRGDLLSEGRKKEHQLRPRSLFLSKDLQTGNIL